jgi:predicted acetyltransferase
VSSPVSSPPVVGPVREDELDGFLATFELVFGITGSEEARRRWRRVLEVDRLVAARDGDRLVSTAGAYSFELSMPGGRPAGCAGVTLVSVRADHRRRGVLRAMMERLFDDATDRGEPFAALWASENPIYGRFGFGPAVPTLHLEIDRAHARFRVPAPVDEVELVDADTAADRFPAVFERVRRGRPVLAARDERWWQRELDDPADRRDGAGEKRYALLGDRGYAIHRLRSDWSDDGVPAGTVEVQDLVATDPDAWASLWRFVVDTDLSHRTVAGRRPVDDPLPYLLDDAARARPRTDWPLYVRLVDVAAALGARGYPVDGALTFEVHDEVLPANAGRWALRVVDGTGTCEPTTAAPQLELDVEELATVALGGVRTSTLATARRVVVHDPAAVARADVLLSSSPAPWHGTMF